jgi:hypothetical protein
VRPLSFRDGDYSLDQTNADRRLMSGSEQPSKTRIGALQDTHEWLGSLRARLSIRTLLVAINLALTAGAVATAGALIDQGRTP